MAMFEDKAVMALGRRLAKIYSEARKGLTGKVDSFFAKFAELDKKKSALVEAGKLTKAEYEKWRMNKLLMGDKYKDLRDSITDNMLHANERAAAIINHEIPNVYAHNFNEVGKGVENKIAGYSFDLTNPETVRKLATDDTTLLPYKFVDGHRDVRWNSTKVNSQILQGILQGESADQMASRLMNVTKMNEESALRNARTAVTSAQNKGRIDAMRQAEDDGVIMGKEWIATKDERTREAHAELDRVVVKVNEPFENEIGQIMYPGDPDADPANTYNCRCAIAEVVLGFKPKEEAEIEPEQDSVDVEQEQHTIVEGQDITDTWERREDQFDFAVKDIMDAQGFDGLPQVASPEEFDKAVEESNIIMQRGYTAPDQETLDAYREQLYNGDWYVDCKGGDALGQGMYTTINLDGEITDRMAKTVEHYGESGYVETMTFTPDAKLINYENVDSEFFNVLSGRKDAIDEIFESAGLSEKESAFVKFNTGLSDEKFEGAFKWFGSLGEERQSQLEDIMGKIESLPKQIPVDKMQLLSLDWGSKAALMGYDGIYSASNEYCVVLNRTKIIIKGE